MKKRLFPLGRKIKLERKRLISLISLIDLNYFLGSKLIHISQSIIRNLAKVFPCEIKRENSFALLYSFVVTQNDVRHCSKSTSQTNRTFRSTQDQVLSTTIYCKCENRSCPGHALQYASNPPSINKPHNHHADQIKWKVEEFKTTH